MDQPSRGEEAKKIRMQKIYKQQIPVSKLLMGSENPNLQILGAGLGIYKAGG